MRGAMRLAATASEATAMLMISVTDERPHFPGAADAARLRVAARDLQRAAQQGALGARLQGKHLCVVGAGSGSARADAVGDGARELGAHVAALPPDQLALGTPGDAERCAPLLGRLYDAIACVGVAGAVVHRLRAVAGIAVLDVAALEESARAALASEPALAAALDQPRRRLLQAALVSALADA
jgi:ornithine carbamoyltransferase